MSPTSCFPMSLVCGGGRGAVVERGGDDSNGTRVHDHDGHLRTSTHTHTCMHLSFSLSGCGQCSSVSGTHSYPPSPSSPSSSSQTGPHKDLMVRGCQNGQSTSTQSINPSLVAQGVVGGVYATSCEARHGYNKGTVYSNLLCRGSLSSSHPWYHSPSCSPTLASTPDQSYHSETRLTTQPSAHKR